MCVCVCVRHMVTHRHTPIQSSLEFNQKLRSSVYSTQSLSLSQPSETRNAVR